MLEHFHKIWGEIHVSIEQKGTVTKFSFQNPPGTGKKQGRRAQPLL